MTTGAPDLFARREELLDAWVAKQHEIAALQAQAAELLAQRWALMGQEIADAPLHRDAIVRSAICEYSAAGHVSKGSMEFAFDDARIVRDDLPAVRESHGHGALTAAHVREIVRESDVVREAIRNGGAAPSTMALYEAAVLEVAEHDTPARTRAHARQVAAALAGDTLIQRHERAVAERSVSVRSVGDGLALLQAVLPEHLAVAIHDRLTQMARHLARHHADRAPVLPLLEPTPRAARDDATRFDAEAIFGDDDTFTRDPFPHGPDSARRPCELERVPDADDGDDVGVDEETRWASIERALIADPLFHDDSPFIIRIPADARTIDQVRADLFTDLLLAGDPGEAHGAALENITATVQVTVAATTLADADDAPAQLDGHGPLHPDVARALAGRNNGWTRLFLDPQGLVTETDTYTPTEPMRRFLRARDGHCRFPGCRMPVHRCEIDHNHDHALGGRTELCNLAHFCRAHHVLKHPDIPDAHRWTARQLPDWTIEWTSPTGRTYRDPAPRRVMFMPSTPPDAAEDVDRPEPRLHRPEKPPPKPECRWASEPDPAAPPGSAESSPMSVSSAPF